MRISYSIAILIFIGIFLSVVSESFAGKPLVAEAPFNEVGTSFCVTLTSGTWTQIPSSNTSGRIAIRIGQAVGQIAGDVQFIFTGSTDAPTLSTTTVSHFFWPSGGEDTFSPDPFTISDQIYMWGISATDQDEVCGIELKK